MHVDSPTTLSLEGICSYWIGLPLDSRRMAGRRAVLAGWRLCPTWWNGLCLPIMSILVSYVLVAMDPSIKPDIKNLCFLQWGRRTNQASIILYELQERQSSKPWLSVSSLDFKMTQLTYGPILLKPNNGMVELSSVFVEILIIEFCVDESRIARSMDIQSTSDFNKPAINTRTRYCTEHVVSPSQPKVGSV